MQNIQAAIDYQHAYSLTYLLINDFSTMRFKFILTKKQTLICMMEMEALKLRSQFF